MTLQTLKSHSHHIYFFSYSNSLLANLNCRNFNSNNPPVQTGSVSVAVIEAGTNRAPNFFSTNRRSKTNQTLEDGGITSAIRIDKVRYVQSDAVIRESETYKVSNCFVGRDDISLTLLL